MKKQSVFQFRLNTERDRDIIHFLKTQSNITLILKVVLRQLIKKYGFVDVCELLQLDDIEF